MSKKEKKEKRGGSFTGWIIMLIIFIGIGFAVKVSLPKLVSHDRIIEVKQLTAEIKSINELASLKYDYREVVSKEKDGRLSNMFIATYDGTIKAGIDMEQVKFDVKNPEEDSNEAPVVKVTVPDAKILSHEDRNSDTVYQSGFGSNIGSDRNTAIKTAKAEKEKEFIQEGNLDKAKEKAETVIEDFIHSSYGSNVDVEFDEK